MNNVSKTLYIPLYGKAYVSRRGLFLIDRKAEEIWSAGGFPLKGKSASKWLAFYMGIRSAVFDEWLKQKSTELDDAVVIHIGCGLDSRIIRTGVNSGSWFDVDFPEVIQERRRYYTESDSYRMIEGDARNPAWLADISAKHRSAIIVIEGVSMYLEPAELTSLFSAFDDHFERIAILADFYTTFAAKASRYKNPVNDVGVTCVYGTDDPVSLQTGCLRFTTEHDMTPDRFIIELEGIERFVFRHLYAGSLSRKLYRMFEYAKN